jgi:hypothetical protein
MSDQTISDVRAGMAERNSPRAPSLADHPLVQLTLVRFLEFVREPEALFWVFVFPLLLAAGLGIAFRNRPAEVLKIAVAAPELAQSLRQEKLLDVQQMNVEAAQESSTAMTTRIPKAAPRACWPIGRSRKRRAASIPWLRATYGCASLARATSIS